MPPHEKWNLCIVIVRAALSRDTAGGWSCDTSTAATPYIRPQLGEIWAEFVVSPGPVLDCPSLYPRTPSSHQIIFSICSAGCRYAMYQYRKISENKWGSKQNNPQLYIAHRPNYLCYLLVLPYYLSHIIQRRYSKYSVFDCGGWKIVISSRLSMARRQWLWKLCPWARLIMIHVIQWWQHPSLVFSILLMYTVHTLHCQPRASPTETMENETHNPYICSNTIINTLQFRSFLRNTDEDYDGMQSWQRCLHSSWRHTFTDICCVL